MHVTKNAMKSRLQNWFSKLEHATENYIIHMIKWGYKTEKQLKF